MRHSFEYGNVINNSIKKINKHSLHSKYKIRREQKHGKNKKKEWKNERRKK